ncbi:HET-domain-containing protein [Trematosphaeria pertusa]|uniref:HET-domain-containing protein n=1 Tax=Trematosphaeria pertusa TaxID=390896 RepID=A0A6A6I628_9PLEO|nr:HET-domain-containing protein [Trematosphaeria pertusa]KAF2245508.1 HET-domain-containing protein [Trematosphaeria pertusa]
MSTLRYERLVKDEWRAQIRLLELLPGQGSAPIRTALHTVDLNRSTGRYEALSYCWGRPGGEIPITCNSGALTFLADATFLARPNLHAALIHLRDPFQSRILWVDAVCINQNDKEEKLVQIGLMTRIYQKCRQVIIWLGMGDHWTPDAFALVPKLVRASRILGRPVSIHKLHPSQWEQLGLPREHEAVYKHFQNLINREWFTRIWTVQEAAVCSKATIVCGEFAVDWDDFLMGVRCIQDYVNGWTPNVWEAFQQCNARQNFLAERRPRLLSLLLRHRHRHAGEDNDKVMGLVGISRDGGRMRLDADYPLPTAEFYKRFALKCLAQDGKLDIFAATRSLNGVSQRNLPSWVPDWSQSERIPFITLNGYEFENNETEHFQYGSGNPDAPGKARLGFRASKGTLYDLVTSNNRNMIMLQGQIVDTIRRISPIIPLPDHYPSSSLEVRATAELFFSQVRLFDEWERLAGARSAAIYAETGEPILSAYWKTICAGHEVLYDAAESELAFQKYDKELRKLRLLTRTNFDKATPHLVVLGMGVAQQVRRKARESRGEDRGGADWSAMTKAVRNRRLSTTALGRLALVPGLTQPRDRVVVARGGDLPLILRLHGRFWELVGEAYVHGIMRGEAFSPADCEPMWLL